MAVDIDKYFNPRRADYSYYRRFCVRMSRRLLGQATIAAFVVLAGLSCGDGDMLQDPPVALTGNIKLRVRVHLLQSEEVDELNATLTDDEVGTLFIGVNRIWEQARITWNVESITREQAESEQAFEKLLRGAISNPLEVLLSIFPRENLLRDEWNVFVLKDLGDIAGGIYISFRDTQVVFFAEFGPTGAQAPAGLGPRILAHELGHSLGLQHVPCTPEGNLMAPGCPAQDRTRLVAAQIEAARLQAATGRAFVGNSAL